MPLKPRAKVTEEPNAVKLFGIVTVTVSPAVRVAGEVGVKFADQVVATLAAYETAVNPTPVTAVPAGVTVTVAVVVPETVFGSSEVTTLIEYEVPAIGFVIPGIVNVAAVPAPTAQLEPNRVTTSVWPMANPVALHDVNPEFNVIGVAPLGRVKPAGKVTEIVSPATSAPPYGVEIGDVVKLMVHGSVACATCVPDALTFVTFEPEATSVGNVPDAGEVGWVSTLVDSEKSAAA